MGENPPRINVNGLDFEWEIEKGRFLFEGDDAVLFWITSAMKVFLDTIEEVSGEEAANLVLESTGYRQGLVVGKYFSNLKDVDIQTASKLITETYASAGWGKTEILDLNYQEKTLTAKLQDSWEHKIKVKQGKVSGGANFLPAHFAGIFTSLFETNIWYKVHHYQLEGYDSTVISYYPSSQTVTQNIHNLARKKELEHIQELELVVEEKTKELQELVQELSSPIIPVLEGIVVVPLIGKYAEQRSEELLRKILENLPSYKANYLVLDLTGLDPDIDEYTASLIGKIGSAASLIGTKTILVGISAELSMVFTQLGIKLEKFDCFQTLQHGIHFALAQLGRQLI